MITIPTRFKNLLDGVTDDVSAAVGNAFSSVAPFLERNEAPFFSDYTDHGISHVESVLRTCDLLLGDGALEVFSREDAAVLILASIAHDLGMLISIEGFWSLVRSDGDHAPVSVTDDQPWPKLWREFQLDSRRFDGAMLLSLLGSTDPVPAAELDPTGLTPRGMKIVGEFLRRHHHRLAHEIVAFGMPSRKGHISLFGDVPEHMRRLSGFIARSHGISMRDCIELLVRGDRTAHRTHRYVHPTFLMALIRLADYLDIDIGRAPESMLAAKSLRSPISRREWWSHRAVVDCHSYYEDPECLYLVVDPSALSDIGTFMAVEDKVKGIQEELDACWAVLGEVYGRFPPLNRLSLKIRRIRSDIREPSKIGQLGFVPYRATIESARSDLLRLLIEPLYGDHPGIGIRELIQNAIDAVRERNFIVGKTPSLSPTDHESLEGDVVVDISKDAKGEYWVTVADRGIGMTWETVRKYYLTAGASFRQSEVWKKRFVDDSGTSQILRSGRFGVGVLAAFLIGDRVRVSTRNIEEKEDQGVEFEFGLDDTIIEMRWTNRQVGTTVSVRTTESVVNKLMDTNTYMRENWDWYCLTKPIVIRKDVSGKKVNQKYKLPGIEGPLPLHWHRIHVPGLQAADWSYRQGLPDLVCNGILISGGVINIGHEFGEGDGIVDELLLQDPKLSVYDPDGRFPLNLARNQMAGNFVELGSNLVDDLCRNFISFSLDRGPIHHILSPDQFSLYTRPVYPALFSYSFDGPWVGSFFATQDGFGLCDPWNISHYVSRTGLFVRANGHRLNMLSPLAKIPSGTYGLVFGIKSNGTLGSFDEWHRKLVLWSAYGKFPRVFKGMGLRGFRTLMPDNMYARFTMKQAQFVTNEHKVELKEKGWVIWTVGNCPDTKSNLIFFANELGTDEKQIESITECYFAPVIASPNPGRIAQMWKNAVGGPTIPFNKNKREQIISGLGDNFKHHLAEWKSSLEHAV